MNEISITLNGQKWTAQTTIKTIDQEQLFLTHAATPTGAMIKLRGLVSRAGYGASWREIVRNTTTPKMKPVQLATLPRGRRRHGGKPR